MTHDEAVAKAKFLFRTQFGAGAVKYNWDMAVEFKDNPFRKEGEMWMVLCSDSDRIYAFVDEHGGDLLGTMTRRAGRGAKYNS